ncbi:MULTISPECIES: D-aminoacyl-tRNA deacylase [Empedobacter]|uniref:D-aminoacyl-tRNA deacylase n=1 Tax=Empedobacter TaxID=59734 RepID=UPI00056FE374|nr:MULTISPECIES: D-aminoacyl-tRNA deacylase [Empedobacter]MBW1617785.1 D-tyrosyl-tRNA(Tyr) deacylase [Empedobacter falsenii]MDH0660156.1 D-aminoacyl-tRNA deacylase [Empedobacter sp. GD03865]MDH0673054.1 D-aminoacyl-tRNA deacylase [Empedobacter sp. GD03861]
MRVILQRVQHASVMVDGEITGKIESGILTLVGFEPDDTKEDFEWISKKIIQLRVFNDENDVMNLDVQQTNGDILVVSQFTLHASTKKGNRPSYIKASKPAVANEQYETFLNVLESNFKPVQRGIFGADMKVELLNDGPVTIFIDSKNKE